MEARKFSRCYIGCIIAGSKGSKFAVRREGNTVEKLRIWFALVSLTIMLLGWPLPVAGQSGSQQRLSKRVEGESVKVSGGSYRNVGSGELWRIMLQKKDFPLINVHIPYEGELPQTDAFIPYEEVEKHLDKLPRSRSEEHTSELQSRLHLVCRLLLEKKKKPLKEQTIRCQCMCRRVLCN